MQSASPCLIFLGHVYVGKPLDMHCIYGYKWPLKHCECWIQRNNEHLQGNKCTYMESVHNKGNCSYRKIWKDAVLLKLFGYVWIAVIVWGLWYFLKRANVLRCLSQEHQLWYVYFKGREKILLLKLTGIFPFLFNDMENVRHTIKSRFTYCFHHL